MIRNGLRWRDGPTAYGPHKTIYIRFISWSRMLHAVCDGHGRPLAMPLSEGQMSDYKGAALMVDALPKAKALLGDRGYDTGWVAPPWQSARSPLASPRRATGKCRSCTIPGSTPSATR